jgi:flavoprotein
MRHASCTGAVYTSFRKNEIASVTGTGLLAPETFEIMTDLSSNADDSKSTHEGSVAR